MASIIEVRAIFNSLINTAKHQSETKYKETLGALVKEYGEIWNYIFDDSQDNRYLDISSVPFNISSVLKLLDKLQLTKFTYSAQACDTINHMKAIVDAGFTLQGFTTVRHYNQDFNAVLFSK